MKRYIVACLSVTFAVLLLLYPVSSFAKDRVDIGPGLDKVSQTIDALQHHQLNKANQSFSSFKVWWSQNKIKVKNDSLDASMEINQDVSDTALDLLNGDQKQSLSSAKKLKQSFQDYQNGVFDKQNTNGHQSLSAYISKLETAKQSMKAHDWTQAAAQVKQLQQDWLSVEGDVVSQSQSVYTESEKDLVMMDAYLAKPSLRAKALPMIDSLIANLKPLASNSYSMWDAALIPVREGLEALLVIGALLTFSKKAGSKAAKRWVWSGTTAALAVCVAVGMVVSLLLSAAAFGNNNSLINGWAGVIASVMLLYVGYWLHRNSDIQRWNHFIRSKTEQAMSQGRMISFAALAFIAVLREGMETVIFLIGMAGRMPASQLILGIAVGFGILVIIGFLMLKIGVLLPLRPFFIISSLVIFYLCFKFMGSGIHSLQMAGVLPSTVADYLPSVNSLSIFPSWYSTVPQALFLLIALVIIARGQYITFKRNKNFKEVSTHQ